MSATAVANPGVGELLREWRGRRRLSQLDLSLEAAVSARHLSFVETGRSRPSRELLLHLAEMLEMPLRDRNALLLAGGYAPVYAETPLDAPELAAIRAALDRVMEGHAPFPAVVVNRSWELVSLNAPAQALLTDGVDPDLLAPPANVLRIALHPDGLAPRIVNLAEYGAHLLTRLRREATSSGDASLRTLHDELAALPGVEASHASAEEAAARVFAPLRLRSPLGELRFFSTIATFGTAVDVTVEELSIEQFFPADAETAAALRAAAAESGAGGAA